MPAVRIEWLEGRSPEIKAKIAKAIEDAIVSVKEANVLRENVSVRFFDFKKSDFCAVGEPFSMGISWFEGRSTDLKAKIAKNITDGITAIKEANLNPENISISFSDVKVSDFFKAGQPIKR